MSFSSLAFFSISGEFTVQDWMAVEWVGVGGAGVMIQDRGVRVSMSFSIADCRGRSGELGRLARRKWRAQGR